MIKITISLLPLHSIWQPSFCSDAEPATTSGLINVNDNMLPATPTSSVRSVDMNKTLTKTNTTIISGLSHDTIPQVIETEQVGKVPTRGKKTKTYKSVSIIPDNSDEEAAMTLADTFAVTAETSTNKPSKTTTTKQRPVVTVQMVTRTKTLKAPARTVQPTSETVDLALQAPRFQGTKGSKATGTKKPRPVDKKCLYDKIDAIKLDFTKTQQFQDMLTATNNAIVGDALVDIFWPDEVTGLPRLDGGSFAKTTGPVLLPNPFNERFLSKAHVRDLAQNFASMPKEHESENAIDIMIDPRLIDLTSLKSKDDSAADLLHIVWNIHAHNSTATLLNGNHRIHAKCLQLGCMHTMLMSCAKRIEVTRDENTVMVAKAYFANLQEIFIQQACFRVRFYAESIILESIYKPQILFELAANQTHRYKNDSDENRMVLICRIIRTMPLDERSAAMPNLTVDGSKYPTFEASPLVTAKEFDVLWKNLLGAIMPLYITVLKNMDFLCTPLQAPDWVKFHAELHAIENLHERRKYEDNFLTTMEASFSDTSEIQPQRLAFPVTVMKSIENAYVEHFGHLLDYFGSAKDTEEEIIWNNAAKLYWMKIEFIFTEMKQDYHENVNVHSPILDTLVAVSPTS
ncbi:hypothetical protein A0H81_13988 [Grifola frondosa]|uniref:Uncharacterized protein n=1 Tax=Grifola frondosa TaxID=5627 RepID=A0A1C7LPX9_GRIFR|nr:hypothetical protein A0H81_13988 [Grifola frondosa]